MSYPLWKKIGAVALLVKNTGFYLKQRIFSAVGEEEGGAAHAVSPLYLAGFAAGSGLAIY